MKRILRITLLLWSTLLFAQPWNVPHEKSKQQSIYYSSIPNIPKTFDPAKAYNIDEATIISQIYEPPYQYHYTKRPYTLIPLTASRLPLITFFDRDGNIVTQDNNNIAKTVYDIDIKPGIYYQPHPAFGATKYRELIAADYVYQIKRLASPRTESPISPIMNRYIEGFDKINRELRAFLKQQPQVEFLDLRQFNLSGVKTLSRYHYQITIKGKYLPFSYWLAMNFFAPIPWEVDCYYSQAHLKKHNISLASAPVGTGPYMMTENNPNKRIVLESNPHFRETFFPTNTRGDCCQGMRLPMVDKLLFTIEKEAISRWNKFLQGYYDKSQITEDSFEQAIKLNKKGQPFTSEALQKKGIQLQATTESAVYYLGFNMVDPVVGGYNEKSRKLRQAIAMAIDNQEYIDIFLNGRGIVAHSIIPPGIFGYCPATAATGSLKQARQLMIEAGYPGGKNPATGKALILHYDTTTSGPGEKARLDWYRQQFEKIGIKLDIRATLYNQLQDKIQQGKTQLFSLGWFADYPDPENFLFLLYGDNAKIRSGGVNATNYQNPNADKLFREIRNMPNNAKRQHNIQQWLTIVRHDMPMIWQFYPINFTLSHQWVNPMVGDRMILNSVKYMRIDRHLREKLTGQWNHPALWPLILFVIFIAVMTSMLVVAYQRREHQQPTKRIERERE